MLLKREEIDWDAEIDTAERAFFVLALLGARDRWKKEDHPDEDLPASDADEYKTKIAEAQTQAIEVVGEFAGTVTAWYNGLMHDSPKFPPDDAESTARKVIEEKKAQLEQEEKEQQNLFEELEAHVYKYLSELDPKDPFLEALDKDLKDLEELGIGWWHH
ncbi:hypothetical protein F4775DRAFT_596003 [Biscogniauxia sp. FL1348]|nr:hypothetical protein F4775DRAFT_596003 [Biscogniauxia sp. FL1348]